MCVPPATAHTSGMDVADAALSTVASTLVCRGTCELLSADISKPPPDHMWVVPSVVLFARVVKDARCRKEQARSPGTLWHTHTHIHTKNR